MNALLHSLARWLYRKTAPQAVAAGGHAGGFTDAFNRKRPPTPQELLNELKNTAWTCASINAATCAEYAPKLYVTTDPRTQAKAKVPTKALSPREAKRLQALTQKSVLIEEVLEHPILSLLKSVNPFLNAFDLWELTTLYQEVHGSAYWLLRFDAFGVPEEVWVLPSQHVTPKRRQNSTKVVDYYEYRSGGAAEDYSPEEVIHFRYPDPRDPYCSGISPLKAAWESVGLASSYNAFRSAKFDNRALPDALISPEEVMGEEERDRLEMEWNAKFRRGGAGRVVVPDSPVKVQLLEQSMGDLAALAEQGKSKEDIANAFHVPIAFLTTNTNLANLYASERQHMAQAIAPRLRRRDEKLNEQLVPLYDPSGRLFLASEDPVPADVAQDIAQMNADLKYGVKSINQVRGERGEPPVEWGHLPWLPLMWAPTDYQGRENWPPPHVGRNRPPEDDDTEETAED